MNGYGAMAMRHWEQHLPERFAGIEEPAVFFAAMGERADERVRVVEAVLAGPDVPGEVYLAKLERMTNARMRAEEIVLPEEVLATPSDDGTSGDTDGDDGGAAREDQWDVWPGHSGGREWE